jgi:hypothetical protein
LFNWISAGEKLGTGVESNSALGVGIFMISKSRRVLTRNLEREREQFRKEMKKGKKKERKEGKRERIRTPGPIFTDTLAL